MHMYIYIYIDETETQRQLQLQRKGQRQAQLTQNFKHSVLITLRKAKERDPKPLLRRCAPASVSGHLYIQRER